MGKKLERKSSLLRVMESLIFVCKESVCVCVCRYFKKEIKRMEWEKTKSLSHSKRSGQEDMIIFYF